MLEGSFKQSQLDNGNFYETANKHKAEVNMFFQGALECQAVGRGEEWESPLLAKGKKPVKHICKFLSLG